jgi:ABC-2 type transport system ATP-binding protein
VSTSPAVLVDRVQVVRGGRHALAGVSMSIGTGAVTGLLGPSGSGKTTLIRCIVGVQIIQSGTVRVLGESAGAPSLRSRIGYMTQEAAVYGDLTVRENLRYFGRVLGVPGRRVDETIDVVGLQAEADRVVGMLSGGQRARASLAAALIGRPELLVLDEPTVGLDPVLRRDLWATFRKLSSDGATLLVSSHVMNEAERCDELVLLRDGRLLAVGAVDEVRRRTGTDDLDEAFLRLVEDGGT